MIVAYETGQADRFERVRSVVMRTKINPDILKDSPVGRIPVMVLDDGTVLSGSWSICEYLDSLHERQKVIPAAPQQKWRELELHGIADGLLDTLLAWRGELMRPKHSRDVQICETCNSKTIACLDWLEQRAKSFAGEDYAIGQITTGIALDYLDFRFSDLDWRKDRPVLGEWHQSFVNRPSTKATEIVNDE
jgi:glutathione S-transferase